MEKRNKYLDLIYLILSFSTLVFVNILINPTDIFSSSDTIIINEFIYDPLSTDLGYEWIELYNLKDESIDINNWRIQIAGTEFKDAVILSNATQNTIVEPYTYYTICEKQVVGCSYYVDKIAMQNGGTDSDGIRILDNKGYVVDTVIYDTPNTNNLIDDTGQVTLIDKLAKETKSGESLGRVNHLDSDNSNKDFSVYTTPTPNELNPIPTELENTGDNILYILLPLFILSLYFGKLIIDLTLYTYLDGKKIRRKETYKESFKSSC